jgi:hypothetical protein
MAFKISMPVVGIILGINAFVKNPSSAVSHDRMTWMRQAMTSFVCCGDPVAASYQEAKYGGSSLSKTVLKTADSDEKRDKNLAKLESLGWRKVGAASWCNGDVMLRIVEDRFRGRSENYFYYGLSFDASTIKRCRSSGL